MAGGPRPSVSDVLAGKNTLMDMLAHRLWRLFDPGATQRRGLTRVASRLVPVPGVVTYDSVWSS